MKQEPDSCKDFRARLVREWLSKSLAAHGYRREKEPYNSKQEASMKRLLLAGETFVLVQSAASGVSVGQSSRYANGATHFLGAMQGANFAIEQLPSERCEADFPRTLEELQVYSAVILSDISALNLLMTPESRQGHASVNRLGLLCEYVRSGGSLMMAGGYTSFQGMEAQARYHETPIEDCLPVICLPYSD